MRANFFCTNFLNTLRGPGHPGKIPGTSQIPLFENQGKQTFEGGHELFDPPLLRVEDPTPPGGLRTQKINLCALFACLISFCRKRGGCPRYPWSLSLTETRVLSKGSSSLSSLRKGSPYLPLSYSTSELRSTRFPLRLVGFAVPPLLFLDLSKKAHINTKDFPQLANS